MTVRRTDMDDDKKWKDLLSARAVVLAVLGALTLGVAALSIKVSYQILDPHFGEWSAPTVAALDLLWVVLQVTEILAGNNVRRARLVRWPGLALTVGIAAIPTADLITSGAGGDLAVVITPAAILATKAVWWFVLRSLGRHVSLETRRTITERRQAVADRLEQMEADAAARIELLQVEGDLKAQISKAEDDYRRKLLRAQQRTADRLHSQAKSTADAIDKKPLPPIAEIELPTFEDWEPAALALPVTPAVTDRPALEPQVGDLTDWQTGTSCGTTVTLVDLAAVAGVPVPPIGEPLSNAQIGLVLRYFRYNQDPPRSYRQAVKAFRRAGFQGSQERVRRVWAEEVEADLADDSKDTADDLDDSEDVADQLR
ncbi:hypothetical protein ACIBKX_40320 [Streptomyces sp. NPDC050658]|uniref:hypothetical protein n=1 Tax=unclassified Streptomyces TaxID=2593676 RepID=UPI003441E9AB